MAKRTFTIPTQFATCVHNGEFWKTQEGLTMTPSQVKELTEKGISVTTRMPNDAPVDAPDQGFFVEPMFRRSVDTNDLWSMEQSTRKKLLQAHKLNVQNYG